MSQWKGTLRNLLPRPASLQLVHFIDGKTETQGHTLCDSWASGASLSFHYSKKHQLSERTYHMAARRNFTDLLSNVSISFLGPVRANDEKNAARVTYLGQDRAPISRLIMFAIT
jgi:hypothetical protein